MIVEISGLRVHYQTHIAQGTPILLLHGWGANAQAMSPIFESLARQGRSVISLDLPGFGNSDPPPSDFGIYEYADFVQKFLENLKISDIILVGHSFGGRISIILAAKTTIVRRMVLVDSAGMKPRRTLSYHIRVFKYKRAKRKNKDLSGFGSSDFKALSSVMRPIFVRVVNQFLECELRHISCPTLLIWGENDLDTPLYMAKRLKRSIRDSGLVVLKNCGHFSYLDDRHSFNTILNEFIKS